MTNNIRPADINDFEAVRGYSRSAVVTLREVFLCWEEMNTGRL